jgi:hypothetical protein
MTDAALRPKRGRRRSFEAFGCYDKSGDVDATCLERRCLCRPVHSSRNIRAPEPGVSKNPSMDVPSTDTKRRYSTAPGPGLASLLFAAALVRADQTFLLAAVLTGVPAVLTSKHPVGLGDDERTVSRCLVHHLDGFGARRERHANGQAENNDG